MFCIIILLSNSGQYSFKSFLSDIFQCQLKSIGNQMFPDAHKGVEGVHWKVGEVNIRLKDSYSGE